MPARTYNASAEIRSPLAICWRISALGLRRPRSIWLRYGFETPASLDSWRSEIFALLRCCLMYSPMSRPRPATLSAMWSATWLMARPWPSWLGWSVSLIRATSSRLRPYAGVLAVASTMLAQVKWVASHVREAGADPRGDLGGHGSGGGGGGVQLRHRRLGARGLGPDPLVE